MSAPRRTPEPFLWLMFSAGGMAAALVAPVVVLLFGVLVPLGWVGAPRFDVLSGLLGNPLVKAAAVVLCAVALMHWAHRFRFVLQHGLRLRRGRALVAWFCYGTALAGAVAALVVVLSS